MNPPAPPPLLGRLFSGQDERQSLRLRRWAQATGLYTFFFVLLLVLAQQGVVALDAGTTLALGLALAGNGLFFVWIKSGWNLRLADPSLTQLQMLYGTVWVFLVAYAASALRLEVLSVYTILFFFGAFKLGTRAYLATAVFATACYAGLLGLLAMREPLDWAREALRLGLFASVQGTVALLGGEMTRLRRANRRQTKALEEANQRIEFQASHDELTQVFNRRHLMATLNREHARAQRSGHPFCVALIDLDHFKSINDNYGHLTGDEVLRRVAACLQTELRGSDWLVQRGADGILARYGGEEFVILLPETEGGAALRCVERLRLAVARLDLAAVDPRLRLSFSAGLAQFQPNETPDEVLGRADRALYRAKSEGRDRSILAAA